MVRLLFLLFLSCLASVPGYCGQSLALNGWSGTFAASANCPAISNTASFRLEFRLHNIGPVASNVVWLYLDCLQLYIQAQSDGRLYVVERVSNTERLFGGVDRQDILVRIQRNIPQGRFDIELWDSNGANYSAVSATGLSYTGSFSASGGGFNAFSHSAGFAQLAFMRAFTSLVPLGSRPPTTADVGDYFDWKFDGNGADASGHGRTVNVSGASFVATPTVAAVAVAKTANTPSWAPFRPLRAGHPGQLDATASFSMADANDEVTCFWQQVPHASGEPLTSQVLFDNRNSCTPTVTGLVFGPYRFRLQVTDADGAKATADVDVGAVAYDENGVVIYPDERLYTLLGPTKVYGSNDWEYPDERLTAMAQNNWKNYKVFGGQWESEDALQSVNGVPRSGTVYVTNGSNKLYGVGTNFLEVFCGGRVGPVVEGNEWAYAALRMDPSFGTYRYRWPVLSCQSDTEATMRFNWEWGTIAAPGVDWTTTGIANFRRDGTGTVYTNPSQSWKLFGTGTNFLSKFCGGVVGPAHPSTPGVIVLESGLTTRKNVGYCHSDTELEFAYGQTWTTTHISSPGVAWGYESTGPDAIGGYWRAGAAASVTMNYYDVGLALYTFYYRSGWIKARDAARFLSGRWWKLSTEWGQAPRSMALVGSMILHLIDTGASSEYREPEIFWPQVRARIATGTARCLNPVTGLSDVRESGYCLQYQALLAQFDPDPNARAAHKAWLVSKLPLFSERQRPNGGFWGADAEDFGSTVATATNGSATVSLHSGTEFAASFCGDPASFQESGTITVTNASTAVSGSGTSFTGAAGKILFIRGTLGGQPYSQFNRVAAVASATSLTLAYPWPGDSGTAIRYRIQAANPGPYIDRGVISFSQSNAGGTQIFPGRVDDDNWYWCTRDSGTQLTLDKPYTGDTTTTPYRRVFGGWGGNGPTTFMQAIMAMGLWDAAKALDGYDNTAAANYRTLATGVNSFLFEFANAPYGTIGLPYFNPDQPFCQPRTVVPNACDQGEPVGLRRSYSVEAVRAFSQQYLATGDAAHKAAGDAWYTALFSVTGFASPFAGDGNQADLLKDNEYLWSIPLLQKNFGQTFGQGGAQTWPAAREGGPAPPQPQELDLGLRIRSVEGAAQLRVKVTSPSGAVSTLLCDEASPCEPVVDRRQGAHWIQWEFLSESGEVLATSEPVLR
jgi:hypothetical protein